MFAGLFKWITTLWEEVSVERWALLPSDIHNNKNTVFLLKYLPIWKAHRDLLTHRIGYFLEQRLDLVNREWIWLIDIFHKYLINPLVFVNLNLPQFILFAITTDNHFEREKKKFQITIIYDNEEETNITESFVNFTKALRSISIKQQNSEWISLLLLNCTGNLRLIFHYII